MMSAPAPRYASWTLPVGRAGVVGRRGGEERWPPAGTAGRRREGERGERGVRSRVNARGRGSKHFRRVCVRRVWGLGAKSAFPSVLTHTRMMTRHSPTPHSLAHGEVKRGPITKGGYVTRSTGVASLLHRLSHSWHDVRLSLQGSSCLFCHNSCTTAVQQLYSRTHSWQRSGRAIADVPEEKVSEDFPPRR